MKAQYTGRRKHTEREYVIAPAHQAFECAAEKLDKPAVDIEIADKGEDCQKQADSCPASRLHGFFPGKGATRFLICF
jgi:hypothetical protein